MVDVSYYHSPLGKLTLAARGSSLIGLWIEGQKYFFSSLREETQTRETSLILQAQQWLDRYFAGEKPPVHALPLAPEGSAFRKEVWDILCQIPYGETTTYGAIAQKIAARHGHAGMSAQAVGGAVGHNPISIIIPCHRVVGTNGSLTGYAGGINLKIKLLEHEGADMSRLFVPKKGTAL